MILIGNVVAAPEMRTTQSGVVCGTFRLAVQRRFANQQGVREADFINVVAWRQLAELCGKYLSKGRKCAVIGSLQTRSYDAQDGSKRYVTEVVADEVEFLGSPNGDGHSRTDEAPLPPEPPEARPTEMQEVDEDDLPF